METLKFKTNIKCGACVAKVTPGLNEVVGKNKWNVDLTHPDRILTVENVEPKILSSTLEKVGYVATPIS